MTTVFATRSPSRLLDCLLIGALLAVPAAAFAQLATTAPASNDATQANRQNPDPSNIPPLPRIFETITVTTTLNPVVVKETPGTGIGHRLGDHSKAPCRKHR